MKAQRKWRRQRRRIGEPDRRYAVAEHQWEDWEDKILRRVFAASMQKTAAAKEVAELTGRTVKACMARAVLKQVPLGSAALGRRWCLSCRQPFMPQHKGLFVCPLCHDSDWWRESRSTFPDYGIGQIETGHIQVTVR